MGSAPSASIARRAVSACASAGSTSPCMPCCHAALATPSWAIAGSPITSKCAVAARFASSASSIRPSENSTRARPISASPCVRSSPRATPSSRTASHAASAASHRHSSSRRSASAMSSKASSSASTRATLEGGRADPPSDRSHRSGWQPGATGGALDAAPRAGDAGTSDSSAASERAHSRAQVLVDPRSSARQAGGARLLGRPGRDARARAGHHAAQVLDEPGQLPQPR